MPLTVEEDGQLVVATNEPQREMPLRNRGGACAADCGRLCGGALQMMHSGGRPKIPDARATKAPP